MLFKKLFKCSHTYELVKTVEFKNEGYNDYTVIRTYRCTKCGHVHMAILDNVIKYKKII